MAFLYLYEIANFIVLYLLLNHSQNYFNAKPYAAAV